MAAAGRSTLVDDFSVEIDPLRQPSFDESVRLAASLVGTPMAAISLLGKESQWFKAEVGLDLSSTPIEYAFCRYAVASGEPLVVEDASTDQRFAENPLVTKGPGIRSYAGAPLLLPNGSPIGTVCVLDTVARSFSSVEIDLLSVLAREVVLQLQVESLLRRQKDNVAGLSKLRTELDQLASRDVLTGLLNRRGFVRELDVRLGARPTHFSRASQAKPTIIVNIDIDDFKEVNDVHGHEVGDRVLSILGHRLREQLGDDDFAARVGTDAFVIALSGCGTERESEPGNLLVETDVDVRVDQLLDVMTQPVATNGQSVRLAASAGHTSVAADVDAAAVLLDRADRAVRQAKQRGGSQSCVWSRTINEVSNHDRMVRAFVRSTLRRNDVSVFFQPVIDLKTGEVIRREALLRWSSVAPAGTDPAAFVAAAETIGAIKDLGRVVLDQSCAAVASWRERDPGVGVAVNISPLQIDGDLVAAVSSALQAHDVEPSLLTLEITESALFDRSSGGIGVLEELHAMGVRISIDDFGSGYSSMSMLCDLPIDEVKIDRQFCSGNDPQLMVIANAAIELGHAMGAQVVAEGIETLAVLDSLIELDCEAGQGFLFGMPGPLEQ